MGVIKKFFEFFLLCLKSLFLKFNLKINTFLKRKNIKKRTVRFNSKQYWENRYEANGTSGPGSYGKLALYKSNFINEFVEKQNIDSIIELGCGDGNQLKLGKYRNYLGFDVSDNAIKRCKELFMNDKGKKFLNYNSLDSNTKAELVLSLDVIFHLVEDEVYYEYMSRLFQLSEKYVLIYSSNYEKEIADHVRSRHFTKWIDENVSEHFQLEKFIPNKYPYVKDKPLETSISDFYIYKRRTW